MKKGGRIFFLNKRGLSNIVITLIITLLALVAIGIVWVVISNLLKSSSGGIGFEKFTINLDITNAYEQSGDITANVKRTVGAGDLIKIKFILSDNANSEVITENSTMQELESNNFVLHPSKLTALQIVSVAVAPVIRLSDETESLGDVTDTYYLIHLSGNQTMQPQPNQTVEQPGQCTPACSGSTSFCVNGNCVQCRDINDCQTGYIGCTNGVCVSKDCSPESHAITCGAWTCGTRINNCGAEISCGSCSAELRCSLGTCVAKILMNSGTVEETWPGNSGMYFGSVDLSQTISYEGNYISFLAPSAETNCLLIALYRLPVLGYPKSHVGFNFQTSIKTGDKYQIWQTLADCEA